MIVLSEYLQTVDPEIDLKIVDKDSVIYESHHPKADMRKVVFYHGKKTVYKIDISREGALRIYLQYPEK